jgi:hypothetical protein
MQGAQAGTHDKAGVCAMLFPPSWITRPASTSLILRDGLTTSSHGSSPSSSVTVLGRICGVNPPCLRSRLVARRQRAENWPFHQPLVVLFVRFSIWHSFPCLLTVLFISSSGRHLPPHAWHNAHFKRFGLQIVVTVIRVLFPLLSTHTTQPSDSR